MTTSAPRAAAPEGPTLAGFVVGDRIGAGAMGAVYRARELSTGRDVAIKWLPFGPATTEAARARFEREARLVAMLRHPNIVTLLSAGSVPSGTYLVMELVDGASLDQLLRSRALGARALVAIMAKVARGLQAAHDAGVVHRDLKPENIVVDRRGEPRIVDFGVACLRGEQGRLTGPGLVCGTTLYIAPEVLGQTVRSSPASDVYSLGVTLHEGLAGAHPFEGGEAVAVFGRILAGSATPLPEAVPPALRAACHVAMQPDPTLRPTAAAWADALEQALCDSGPSQSVASPARARAWIAASARAWTALAFVVLGATFAGGVFAVSMNRTTTDADPRDASPRRTPAPDAASLGSRLAIASSGRDFAALAAIASEVTTARSEAPVADQVAALVALGRALVLHGRADEAEPPLGRALDLEPTSGPALFAAWAAAIMREDPATAARRSADIQARAAGYSQFVAFVEALQRSPLGGAGPGGEAARRQARHCPDPEVYVAVLDAVTVSTPRGARRGPGILGRSRR